MPKWIKADTPPEEDGRYMVFLDKRKVAWTGVPWLMEERHYSKAGGGWSVHANDGEVIYWQPLPEPPLEDMIRKQMRDGRFFLVPPE